MMILCLSSKHLNKIVDNICLYVFYVNPFIALPSSTSRCALRTLTLFNNVQGIAHIQRNHFNAAPGHWVCGCMCVDMSVSVSVVESMCAPT